MVDSDQQVGRLKRKKITAFNIKNGCDGFESNGLPAHPEVLEKLEERNPQASVIPSDETALENGLAFDMKATGFPHVVVPEYNEETGLSSIQRQWPRVNL